MNLKTKSNSESNDSIRMDPILPMDISVSVPVLHTGLETEIERVKRRKVGPMFVYSVPICLLLQLVYVLAVMGIDSRAWMEPTKSVGAVWWRW